MGLRVCSGFLDLFGFSMGGMISQEIVLKQPNLVRKMILSGTGPAGGTGISTVGRVSNWDLVRGMATRQDPKVLLPAWVAQVP